MLPSPTEGEPVGAGGSGLAPVLATAVTVMWGLGVGALVLREPVPKHYNEFSLLSGGGQEQTRLRSPQALSTRLTGAQYLSTRNAPGG